MSAPKRARDDEPVGAAAGGAGGPPPPPPPPARRLPLAEDDDAYERRLKLTDVIGFVALNGFAREANACSGLCRETWRCIPAGLGAADADRVRRDHPLWQAIIDLGHGKRKQTRLAMAVQHGSLARVRELCDWRAQVDAVDSGGWTPLFWASIKCITDVVRELLARGANIEATIKSGWTSLHAASLGGKLAVVRELLAHGADPNTANIYGETPLIGSSRNGRVEVVRALLAAGADKHHADVTGDTAASVAGGHYAPHSRAAILALLAAAPLTLTRFNSLNSAAARALAPPTPSSACSARVGAATAPPHATHSFILAAMRSCCACSAGLALADRSPQCPQPSQRACA